MLAEFETKAEALIREAAEDSEEEAKRCRRRTQKDREAVIRERLGDAPRSGAPPTFTAEQLTQLIALSCKNPKDFGAEVTHWTPAELALKAVDLKIVPTISPRHVGRLWSEAALQPHRIRYWLTSPDKLENPALYSERVQKICDIYAEANKLEDDGTLIGSIDEKPGIQALERNNPGLPMESGSPAKADLPRASAIVGTPIVPNATMNVTINASVPWRLYSNVEFRGHVEATIDLDPAAGWVLIMDQLNTHMSEELVRVVARRCEIPDDLGVKGRNGILKSRHTRRKAPHL
ncbi:MAG: transposase [Deltaproteobacteria bacterium]|nr:transposase [Deltaproteobacteria bacterium]